MNYIKIDGDLIRVDCVVSVGNITYIKDWKYAFYIGLYGQHSVCIVDEDEEKLKEKRLKLQNVLTMNSKYLTEFI